MAPPPNVDELNREYIGLESERTRSDLQELAGSPEGAGVSISIQLASKRKEAERAVRDMVASSAMAENLGDATVEVLVDLLMADLGARSAEARKLLIQEKIEEYELYARQLPLRALEKRRLEEEVETLRDLYMTFTQEITQAQIAQTFEAQKLGGELVITDPPVTPSSPVYPNRKMIMLLAAMAGFFLGVVLVILVEYHDTTIRDISELPLSLRQRVIGSVPLIRERVRKEREYRKAGLKGKDNAIPIFDYYRDEAASSFEFRRLVLELSHEEGRLPGSIMITSSERAEGKTLTSCLLALTIARHRRVRTLLVDLDFRKPTVHKQLGIPRVSPGSAEALMERSLNREAIRATPEGNLFVLPAGSFRNVSAESVSPDSIRNLLSEIHEWFDVVVIDSPPNLAVPDPLVIGQSVDKVLFVVRAGKTSRRVLSRGFEMQVRANDNVAGLVVNNVQDVMPYYYNYEHYGYIHEDEPQETVVGGDRK
jgi:capsular exopolysaccharide synthesis family protein